MFYALEECPLIQMNSTNTDYDHPDIVYDFFKKLPPEANNVICGEHLLLNHSLSHVGILDFAKFVYFIRPGSHTIQDMMRSGVFTPNNCLLHYSYRLQRICEMARKTPGAVLLTWEDLQAGRGMDLVGNYLRVPYRFTQPKVSPFSKNNKVAPEILKKADECYERYYYYLRQFDLVRSV